MALKTFTDNGLIDHVNGNVLINNPTSFNQQWISISIICLGNKRRFSFFDLWEFSSESFGTITKMWLILRVALGRAAWAQNEHSLDWSGLGLYI